jgi:integrase
MVVRSGLVAAGDRRRVPVVQAVRTRRRWLAGLRKPRPASGCPSWPTCGAATSTWWQREITVRGKGGKDRIVRIGHHTARSLDRYLRARSRHPQAHRPQLWLGTGNREPLTAAGIYQMITRRGRQCGVDAYPHRFRHHFSHTWLDRGGPEGDLMELNGWTSPQMLRRYGASARSARARRTYDRIMTDT